MTTQPPDLLPIGEAAKLLGVSVETIRRWDTAGKLASVRTLGGQRRFSRADIEAHTEQPDEASA